MQSKATSVSEYIAALPHERRAAIEAVRRVILANLDDDYEEGMQYGMIGYYVPHHVFPPGYHCDPRQPLPFACLAAQKNHVSLHLMGLYLGCGEGQDEGDEVRWFRDAWARTGKKLDMGKSCVRFRRADDVALEVVGEAIRRLPARTYIARYRHVLATMGKRAGANKPAPKAAAKPSAAKRAPAKKSARAPAKKSARAPAKKSARAPKAGARRR
jgi:hypothetical protein